MLLDPAQGFQTFMNLTGMSLKYELFLLVLAAAGFVSAYCAERYVFPLIAKYIGRLERRLSSGHRKKRKRYKELLEELDG